LGFFEEGLGIGRGNGERQFAVVTLDRNSLEEEMKVPIKLWGDDLQAALADAERKFADGKDSALDEGKRGSVDFMDDHHVTEFNEKTFEERFRKRWTPPHRQGNPEGELKVSVGSLLAGF